MAAPDYVPTDSTAPKSYRSPDVVPSSWSADRRGAIEAAQPAGLAMGSQGPDQGYALALARHFEDKVVLVRGEHWADVMAGAVEVAMKRASIYGRAPVIHDIEIALSAWGFLGEAPKELVEARTCFEGIAEPHHWRDLRAVVAMVPEATLRMSPASVRSAHSSNWQDLLDLS